MKHFTFDNHWDAIKAKLKQRYSQLTDDDLVFAKGKGQELLVHLRHKLELSAKDLDELLNELRAEVDEVASDALTKAEALAEDLKAKAAAVGNEAKAQGAAAYDYARQRARTLREDGEEYVRQNPRESLVAALCAGFVAGLLIWR